MWILRANLKIVVLWRARITMQQWRLLIYCARTKVFAIFIIISNESNEKGAWRQDDSSYLSLRILYTTLSFELLIATIRFTKRFFPWNSILESFRSPIWGHKVIMISLLLLYKTSATKLEFRFLHKPIFKKPQKSPCKKSHENQ